MLKENLIIYHFKIYSFSDEQLRQILLYNVQRKKMRIVLKTKVKGNYKTIMRQFDKDLFIALAPPFPKIKLVEFTGSKKGDKVHIKFLAPVNSDWVSDITADYEDENETYFIDEGITLPWPLKFWKHKHIIEKIDDHHSIIVDDITYQASNGLLSILLYPAMFFGFLMRKPIYRKYFG